MATTNFDNVMPRDAFDPVIDFAPDLGASNGWVC